MEEALLICRFLHFSAAMALLGTTAFVATMMPAPLRCDLERPLRLMTIVLLAIAGLTTISWFGIEAATLGDGWSDAVNPDNLVAVITGTGFGAVWCWHAAIMALLIIAYFFAGPRRWPVLMLLSTLFLGSLGFIGHAAMLEGAIGWLQRLTQALHVISSGLWVGVLLPLAICLTRLRQPALRADVSIALHRFSGIGHFAVALVILTGVVNTFLIVGGLPINLSSRYQLLLDIKIALVLVMALIAVVNRYVFVPAMTTRADYGLRNLVGGTVAEIVLSAGVIALVSAFATYDPK